MINDRFEIEWRRAAALVHELAKEKGFWDRDRNFGEAIALCHSELSEALEAHRNNNANDDKIDDMPGVSVELADCIIRIMDLDHALGLNVGEAIRRKFMFNAGRPYKHGKSY